MRPELGHRVAAGLARVVPGDGDRVEARQDAGGELDHVRGEPHGGPGREDVGLPGEELLEDVVLQRARQLLRAHALPLRRDQVGGEDDRGGGVDGEVDRDLVQRQAGEQVHHVVGGVDGDADPPHLGPGHLVIGVVAELGGQVERDRQRGLPAAEQEVEAGIGLFRGPVASELPHRPELPAVHGLVRAPGERRLARPPEARGEGVRAAGHVLRRVDRRDRYPRVGGDGWLPAGWAPGSCLAITAPPPASPPA